MKVRKKPRPYFYGKGLGLFFVAYSGTEAGRELFVNGWKGPAFAYYAYVLVFGVLIWSISVVAEIRWEKGS
ncbi:hypothetical protein E6H23_00955 [Candidatus Bathyarchaeota archaeon]|nr:MAG: hypothetical protein E6H23_00955 [Candidatus Bathyarchaeota archaeon]